MRRRGFFHRIGAGALLWPAQLEALQRALAQEADPWERVREAFLLPRDRIYLNAGTLGVQPRVVVDAVGEHTRRVAMSYPPGVAWDTLKAETARLLHADADGLVFPRNTTEAMNFIANGLDLQAGDEVLTTNHEHIGGLCCWQLLAARRGIVLRQLELPATPRSPAELVHPFRAALTGRTRVLSFSHVNFTNGVIMPAAELVSLARQHGCISVVDGAHPPGLMPVDLNALDADFYASSPHKWLLAPQGTGLLYLRANWRTRLWPTLASGDWDNLELGAQRLNHLGSLDESRLAGLLAALRFHDTVGSARVHARIAELRRLTIDLLRSVPAVELVSPVADQLGAGMVSFRVHGIEAAALQQRLAAEANIRTRVIAEYDYGWMRLSPHIYTRPAELERTVALIARAAAR